MLKARREAAEAVAVDFLKAEAAVDRAALMASACVATMLDRRARANLPVSTGMDALRLVSEAANDLVSARQRLIEAHGALLKVRDGVGLRAVTGWGYGDQSECPPYEENGASVDAPRLAIVA